MTRRSNMMTNSVRAGARRSSKVTVRWVGDGEGKGWRAYSTDRVLQASGVVVNVHSCGGIIYIVHFYLTNRRKSRVTIALDKFRDLSQATLGPGKH